MQGPEFAVAVSLFCAAWPVAAQPASPDEPAHTSWVRVATANFELYTTSGEAAGRGLIDRLERLRPVLQSVLPGKGAPQRPVCIIAFRSHDEFQPYAPISRATGFYLPGARRDFIVLDTPSPETRTAAHEYGHLVIAQSGLRLPPWLNEGLAELYSNVAAAPPDPRIVVGQFIPSRVLTLRRSNWIGLTELVSAGVNAPAFTSPGMVDSAYAESWLLAHMLVLDPAYAARFPSFLLALQTSDTPEAFGTVYGKSTAQVERDMSAYLEKGQANARVTQSSLPVTPPSIDVELDADFGARLALAEMLRDYRGREEQARQIYQALRRDYPLRPELETGIPEIYRSEGNQALAAEHRERAAVPGAMVPSSH
jgi:hypothetical protein